jgi:hypothetical protein
MANMTDEEFEALFSGKYDVAGGENYKGAYDFVDKHKDPRRVCESCMVFFAKPTGFLITGKTASGRGDGVAVADKISEYLPHHVDKFEHSASWRKGVWEDLNTSMIRRIALLCFEYGSDNHKLIQQYTNKYGRPSELATEEVDEVESDTKKIMRISAEKFVTNDTAELSKISAFIDFVI